MTTWGRGEEGEEGRGRGREEEANVKSVLGVAERGQSCVISLPTYL